MMHSNSQPATRFEGAPTRPRHARVDHSSTKPSRFTGSRKMLSGLAALAVAAAVVIVPLATSSSATTVPLLGSYDGAANPSGASSFASETGTATSVYSDYAAGENETWTDWNNTIDWLIPQLKGQLGSSRLELSVPLASGGYSSQAAALAAFAADPSTFDANMTSLAQTLISNGFSNTIIRLMWEPQELGLYSNDDLTSAANYADLFRDAHTAMDAVSGASFQWAWYWEANFDANTNNTAYPGSAYVDYITNDFYDQSWVTTCGVPYNGTAFSATQENCLWNASNGYAATLKNLTDFATQAGKPIGIGEWGVIGRSDNHGGNDDPTFIADYAAWMKSSNVAWASYFNFNDGGLNSTLSDFPNSMAAFKSNLGGSGSSSSSAPAPPAPTTTTTPPPAPTTTTTAADPTTTTTAPAPTDHDDHATCAGHHHDDDAVAADDADHRADRDHHDGADRADHHRRRTPPASSGPPPGSITVTSLDVSPSTRPRRRRVLHGVQGDGHTAGERDRRGLRRRRPAEVVLGEHHHRPGERHLLHDRQRVGPRALPRRSHHPFGRRLHGIVLEPGAVRHRHDGRVVQPGARAASVTRQAPRPPRPTAPPVRFSAVQPASLSAWAAAAERPPTWQATTTVTSCGISSRRSPSCPSGMLTPIG